MGYFRNFLLPEGYARVADESVLAAVRAKQEAEEAAARQLLAEAKALATALQTIGKFTVRVKTGDGKDKQQIFGSVTAADVVEAVRQQTNRELVKGNITVPEVKTTGTYDVSVKLHPQVNVTFQLVVAKLAGPGS
jgi:large subunit ribosomal protein L9